MNKKATIALSQIGILIVSILAIGFLIGLTLPEVSALDSCDILGGTCVIGSCSGETEEISATGCSIGQVCCFTSSNLFSNDDGTNGFGDHLIGGVIGGGTNLLTQYGAKKLGISGGEKVTEKVVEEAGKKVVEETVKKASWFANKNALAAKGMEGGSLLGPILAGAAAAFSMAILIDQAMGWIGASERNDRSVSTAAYVAAGGVSIGVAIAVIAGFTASTGGIALFAAVAVLELAAIYMAFTYQDYSQEVFVYEVHQWQPGTAGDPSDCEACNDLEYGCSEYQCHSYGIGCELINVGTSDQSCYWNNPREFDPPQIYPLESVLLSEDYSYKPLTNLPPERGTQITYLGTCVPAFTPIVLGVKTNELTQCRIDIQRKDGYDEMVSLMAEGTSYVYNHTFALPTSLTPSKYLADKSNFSIQNGGRYDFYIRCKDANGILSTYDYQMSFCVNDGPDLNEPRILKSNYPKINGVDLGYIQFGVETAPLIIYTDEPATCRWDYQDLIYEDMKGEFDKCSQSLEDYLSPSTLEYGCEGEVSGIKSRESNKYFVRCRDKPLWTEEDEERQITNKRSYPIYLMGTEPIVIDSISVNGKGNNSLLKDSTEPIRVLLEVSTLGGAEEGKTRCEYFFNGKYTSFYNEGSRDYTLINTQELRFYAGNYNLPIQCYDIGGNVAKDLISFRVEIDKDSPGIARAYYEDGKLKIITTEIADCYYSNFGGCTYNAANDGSPVLSEDGINHYLPWDTESTIYLKCIDEFGNQPFIDQCTMIVKAHEREEQ